MTRTSAPRIRTFKGRHPSAVTGFTLIEILVVISLIALVMSFAIPNFGAALRINLNNSARELATTIRATYDEAVLKGAVYRLAFDLDKNEYWVEVGDRDFLLRSEDQLELERKRDRKRSDESKKTRKEPFSLARAVTKKKIGLPAGVKFVDVQTTQSKDPLKQGVAYAHVFPHGFVEKLVLHLRDRFEREATLIVSPVTGKSRLFDHYVKESE